MLNQGSTGIRLCVFLGAALLGCGGGSDGGSGAGAGGAGVGATTVTNGASGSSSTSIGSASTGTGGSGTSSGSSEPVTGGTTGSGGAAGGVVDAAVLPGPDGGLCGASAGACVDPTDCSVGKTTLDAKVTICAMSCTGGSKCTADCLAKEGATMGCATCYGDVTQCGRDNCSAQCIFDATSSACRDCTKTKGCVDKFQACAGW